MNYITYAKGQIKMTQLFLIIGLHLECEKDAEAGLWFKYSAGESLELLMLATTAFLGIADNSYEK